MVFLLTGLHNSVSSISCVPGEKQHTDVTFSWIMQNITYMLNPVSSQFYSSQRNGYGQHSLISVNLNTFQIVHTQSVF